MLSKKNYEQSEVIPSLECQYDDIMNNFDFKHVHMLMCWDKARVNYDYEGNHIDYKQWKMYDPVNNKGIYDEANFEIPSITKLKELASKLLKEVIRFSKYNRKSKFYCSGTGPFKATYRYGIIELACIFEDWSYD